VAALLDVNALIALVASDRVSHLAGQNMVHEVTDVYLLGLAARRKGTMVSFDRSLAWQAVRNGSERLIQHPGK
jgi:predicted nucleic acid-binding protein